MVAAMLADRAAALALDAADPLAFARRRFVLPQGVIYLDGNSLGALPRRTAARVADAVTREWGEGLIRSWNDAGWIDAPARTGGRIARLIGAHADEVVAADSTSVNVFKLAAAAIGLNAPRRVVVTEAGNFPTDLYMLQGLRDLGAIELRVVAAGDIAAALDSGVAALLLTHVNYKSGAVHDMAALTARAHASGALAIWDLSHSTGAVAVDLGGCDADLATGCGYKYLNGGPGAPAYVFAAARHHQRLRQPLQGWLGHSAPFAFDDDYRPGAGMARMLCGTPGILGLAALDAGVATFDGIDMTLAEAKSRALGDMLHRAGAGALPGFRRGLSDRQRAARRAGQPRAPGRLCDLPGADRRGGDRRLKPIREPDILRFGFPALYTRYADIWDAAKQARRDHGGRQLARARIRRAPRRHLTLSTILPTWSPASMRQCASAASASGNTMSVTARSLALANSGQTLARSWPAIAALNATGRGRSVEPVERQPLEHHRMPKSTSARAPRCSAIETWRPSGARQARLRGI